MALNDDKVLAVLVNGIYDAFARDRQLARVLRRCESEIEKLMLIAFWTRTLNGQRLTMSPEHGVSVETLKAHALSVAKYTPFVGCQIGVGKYRVDFCIASPSLEHADKEAHLLAVECDGHEFHEKTKEQAARDKQRDRDLLSHGVTVIRFSGSEVWRDASRCVEEALRLADNPIAEEVRRGMAENAA